MSDGKKMIDGGTINGMMTAYLNGLHSYRGGKLSPADSMHHLLDVMDKAQRAMSRIDRFKATLFGGHDKKD